MLKSLNGRLIFDTMPSWAIKMQINYVHGKKAGEWVT